MRRAVPPVLVPRRHPEPRRARDARVDPRGRRARLRAGPRLRRGVRQPGPGGLCVVGDGEAETGPLATSWHSNKFLNPARDGAVLPILHLNGYKIANPTVLARIPREELAALLEGYGHRPIFVEGDEPADDAPPHGGGARRGARRDRRDPARARASEGEPRAPALADDRAAHAQGLDRPKEVDGCPPRARGARTRCRSRSCASSPSTSPSSRPGCARYRPEELFDEQRRAARRAARAGARGRAADGREPARQRRPAARGPAPARLPRLRRRGAGAGDATSEATRVLGGFLRDVMRANARHASASSAPTRPPPTAWTPCSRSPAGPGMAETLPDRRPPGARRPRDGGPERAPVPGLARGLPADRPPRPVQLLRGVHPHRRLDVQPARQVAEGHARHPVAAADRVAQLPAHLARLAPGPQRLLAPGPGLHRPRGQQEGRDRPRVPAARRQLPAVGRRPLPAQPRLRQRDRGRQAARARLPDHGRGDRALHARHRDLGLGEQRRRRRAGRRDGLRRRHPDARDAGGRRPPARAPAGPARCAWSTSST